MTLTWQAAPFAMRAEGNILHACLDLDVFRAAFHSNQARTRMFLLCHPHNPTGQAFTIDELRGMAEACLSNETIIVSDEIHSELLLKLKTYPPRDAFE